jgi:hypothetical protein
MLYFPPAIFTILRLLSAPDHSETVPQLEMTALGAHARELAADVLVDADSVADLVLLDHAAIFSFDAAGERHELRLELDDNGRVIGAATWWLGAATSSGRYDLSLAYPAIAESATLDAVTVEDDLIVLEAGGVRVPLGDDKVDDDIVDPWDTEPGC